MPQIGNRINQQTGDTYLYVEGNPGVGSMAVGVDGANAVFTINTANFFNVSPDEPSSTLSIDPIGDVGIGAIQNLNLSGNQDINIGAVAGQIGMQAQTNVIATANTGNFTAEAPLGTATLEGNSVDVTAMAAQLDLTGQTNVVISSVAGSINATANTSFVVNATTGLATINSLTGLASLNGVDATVSATNTINLTSTDVRVSSLTAGGVVLADPVTGELSLPVSTPGTNGQILIAATGGVPDWNLPLNSDGLISITTAPQALGIDIADATADGQLLIGANAAPFARATLTAGTNVTINNGANSITINSTPPASAVAFAAKLNATVNNVTGDGTVYTVICGTERFDTGGNYNNATGVFLAPATGIYQFSWGISVLGLTAAFTQMQIQLITTGGNWMLSTVNPGTTFVGAGDLAFSGSTLVNMTAGDTANLQIVVSGSTLTIDLYGDAGNNPATYFSGFRVA